MDNPDLVLAVRDRPGQRGYRKGADRYRLDGNDQETSQRELVLDNEERLGKHHHAEARGPSKITSTTGRRPRVDAGNRDDQLIVGQRWTRENRGAV